MAHHKSSCTQLKLHRKERSEQAKERRKEGWEEEKKEGNGKGGREGSGETHIYGAPTVLQINHLYGKES